jgi:hypothetical protein
MPRFDGANVVFGRVVEGLDTVNIITTVSGLSERRLSKTIRYSIMQRGGSQRDIKLRGLMMMLPRFPRSGLWSAQRP